MLVKMLLVEEFRLIQCDSPAMDRDARMGSEPDLIHSYDYAPSSIFVIISRENLQYQSSSSRCQVPIYLAV